MRLNILTEATTLKESPFDIEAEIVVSSKEYSIGSQLDQNSAKEYIRGLNVDKVVDAVSNLRPYVSTFFKAILDRDYDSVLDVLYPVSSMLVGPFANNSAIVDEFKSVLSIGQPYYEAVNKYLEFYKTVEGDSSLIIKKVQAIYSRFKDNRAKVLAKLFNIYEEYEQSLSEGKESAKSRKLKQALYVEYVRNQTLIENVLDEVSSLSKKKTEDSPLKTISGLNYTIVSKYFEDNRSDMKKISAKLLYLTYFHDILSGELGSLYSTTEYNKFTIKKDKNQVTSEINELLGSVTVQHTLQVSNKGFALTIPTISSVDLPALLKTVLTISEDSTVKLTFIDIAQELRSIPLYGFYYAYDKVFGTNNLTFKAAKLFDTDTAVDAINILAHQPMTDDFTLGEYSFEEVGGDVVSKNMQLVDLDKISNFIKVFAIVKEFDSEAYADEVNDLIKKLSNKTDTAITLDELMREIRKNKMDAFNGYLTNAIKAHLRNTEEYSNIVDILTYVAYHSAINDVISSKQYASVFTKVLKVSQDVIVDCMIEKAKGDPDKLAKIQNFMNTYMKVLSVENQNKLGVTLDAE